MTSPLSTRLNEPAEYRRFIVIHASTGHELVDLGEAAECVSDSENPVSLADALADPEIRALNDAVITMPAAQLPPPKQSAGDDDRAYPEISMCSTTSPVPADHAWSVGAGLDITVIVRLG